MVCGPPTSAAVTNHFMALIIELQDELEYEVERDMGIVIRISANARETKLTCNALHMRKNDWQLDNTSSLFQGQCCLIND